MILTSRKPYQKLSSNVDLAELEPKINQWAIVKFEPPPLYVASALAAADQAGSCVVTLSEVQRP